MVTVLEHEATLQGKPDQNIGRALQKVKPLLLVGARVDEVDDGGDTDEETHHDLHHAAIDKEDAHRDEVPGTKTHKETTRSSSILYTLAYASRDRCDSS